MAQMTNMGAQQLVVSTTAVAPTLPNVSGQPDFALFRTSGDVRWRDDGTNPTSSIGMSLLANESMEYDGELSRIKFIRSGAADATLDIAYYRSDG